MTVDQHGEATMSEVVTFSVSAASRDAVHVAAAQALHAYLGGEPPETTDALVDAYTFDMDVEPEVRSGDGSILTWRAEVRYVIP